MRPTPQDTALIRAAQQGDGQAWDALIRIWSPVVLRWCARLGRPGPEAEDSAQTVLLLVLERLDRLRDPQAFPAWLYRVTRSVVQRRQRSAWVRRWLPMTGPELTDPRSGPVEVLEHEQEARAVLDILSSLPLKFREVLVLCELESRTELEVSMLLEVPLGTVKSRLRRGREAFARKAVHRGLLDASAAILREESSA